MKKYMRLFGVFVFAATLIFIACDGGGGDSPEAPSAPPTWQQVGTAGFSPILFSTTLNIPLVFDAGAPHVAFIEETGGAFRVMKYNGTAWETLGTENFQTQRPSNISLAFKNNIPYIPHNDSSGIGVKKYNKGTNTWDATSMKIPISSGYSQIAYLAFDNTGTTYLAYSSSSESHKASVVKHDGTTWNTVGGDYISTTQPWRSSFVLNQSGVPYFSYRISSHPNKAAVMKYNGTDAWEPLEKEGFTAYSVDYLSLAFDVDTPYVAFRDSSSSPLYKASVMKYDESTNTWGFVGAQGFSADEATYTSLAIYNGVPYVAFQDKDNANKATLMKYNSVEDEWVFVGDAGFSAGEAKNISLTFYNGVPYVAYEDGANGNKVSVMKFQ